MKDRMTMSGCALLLAMALVGCRSDAKETGDERQGQAQQQTTKNLEAALSGEGEANRKYTAFAEIADKEGYPAVARLWRAAAAAEAVHAKNHMKVLGMLGDTKANLKAAVSGEQFEFNTMYPEYIKTAEAAGNQEAARSMEYAFKVEQGHFKLFNRDLKELEEGKKPELVSYWICGECGNTVPRQAPAKCPICGQPKQQFFEVK